MEFNRNDIRNIAFEKINDRFSRGKYLGLEVTIDMTTGYINGNHLVKQATTKGGEPKRIVDWRRSKEAKEIIEFLESAHNCTGHRHPSSAPNPLLMEIVNVPNELKGTYVDPTLVGHLAQWASPVLAHKVLQIVKQYAIDAAIAERNKLLQQKDDKIDELSRDIKELKEINVEQSRQIAELLGHAKNTSDTLKRTEATLDHVVQQNDTLIQESRETAIAVECLEYQVDRATEAIEIILPNKTVTPPSDSVQFFCVYAHSLSATRFYAVRGQQANLTRTSAKLAKSGYIVAPIYSREDPNPFHSFNTLKRLLDEGARALLQCKKARGRYSLKNAVEEFGSYRLNTITCSRDRLDSLLVEIDRLRAAMDH